jgi:hypothetical protein
VRAVDFQASTKIRLDDTIRGHMKIQPHVAGIEQMLLERVKHDSRIRALRALREDASPPAAHRTE